MTSRAWSGDSLWVGRQKSLRLTVETKSDATLCFPIICHVPAFVVCWL